MYYSKDARIQRLIAKNPYYKDPLAKRKQDLFDPHKIKEICVQAQQLETTDEKMKFVVDELAKAYPGHINKPESWVWNYNGGGLAQLSLIHASLREYLAIWGTPIGNNGFSGRYTSDVYDFMFDGEMEVSVEGSTKKFLFKGGDCASLPRGVAKVYSIKENGWMIDYGRGYDTVVGMLPFGLGDSIVSAQDARTFFKTLYLYGKLTIKELFGHGKDLGLLIKKLLYIGIAALLIGLFIKFYIFPF